MRKGGKKCPSFLHAPSADRNAAMQINAFLPNIKGMQSGTTQLRHSNRLFCNTFLLRIVFHVRYDFSDIFCYRTYKNILCEWRRKTKLQVNKHFFAKIICQKRLQAISEWVSKKMPARRHHLWGRERKRNCPSHLPHCLHPSPNRSFRGCDGPTVMINNSQWYNKA